MTLRDYPYGPPWSPRIFPDIGRDFFDTRRYIDRHGECHNTGCVVSHGTGCSQTPGCVVAAGGAAVAPGRSDADADAVLELLEPDHLARTVRALVCRWDLSLFLAAITARGSVGSCRDGSGNPGLPVALRVHAQGRRRPARAEEDRQPGRGPVAKTHGSTPGQGHI
jgi:hypothetical protein